MAKLGEALEAADKEFLSWLFREMRTQRVSSLEFKGLNVVLRQDAAPDPTKEEVEARKVFLASMAPEQVKHDSVPPQVAGPLLAAAMMAGNAPPPWLRPQESAPAMRDPTDPDNDIDDNELMGQGLPVDH